ncbi:MAG: flagellar hook-basal body protein [Lawsonibacter sp.]|jgi:flagellar basal-body rod protein FlgF
MTKGFYNLTSGMLSQSRRLDVVANNMTNVTTPGYKQERYTDTTFDEVLISRVGNKEKQGSTPVGQGSYILAPSQLYVDYDQGAIEETGLNLDFAIQGEGFFAVETANGVEYTRNGSFSLDAEGYLCLPGHGRVLGADGALLALGSDQIQADDYGRIYAQEGGGLFGQIGVYTFGDNEQLTKGESGLFDANGQVPQAVEAKVTWRSVENSNVDMLQEMSQMMTAQRALQSAAQVLKLYDGVLTKATTEIGRL